MKVLTSIFTDNMSKCLVTGMESGIEIHHIFGGTDRTKSEIFSFCVPLHRSVHPNGAFRTDRNWTELDHWLKRKCQEYYIEVAQYGDRNSWYQLFGRFYDDRCDEKVWLNGKYEWRLNDGNQRTGSV